METNDIKEQMKAAIFSEIEQWSDECKSITDGYEFEERLLQRVRTIGKIMMQQSVGAVPENRNKKNFTPVWAK